MEAKDTVMSDEELRKLFGNLEVVFKSQATNENKMAAVKILVNRWVSYKAEISFKAGIKKGLARHENPLDGPCIFCGYNGRGYWQKGTHLPDCPFVDIGGEADRQAKLKEWK